MDRRDGAGHKQKQPRTRCIRGMMLFCNGRSHFACGARDHLLFCMHHDENFRSSGKSASEKNFLSTHADKLERQSQNTYGNRAKSRL
jgi:hypothetical protein